MQIRLYLDEDASSRSLVRGFRVRGIDVLSCVEAANLQRSDVAQLEFAAREKRVLYMYNVADFYHLHSLWSAEGRTHSGIILVAQKQLAIGAQLRSALKLIASKSAEEMQNRAEFLSRWA